MLTIAIPTYNRARLLDRQLRWLAGALPGHEHSVEILISDNASTDHTPAVVERWRPALDAADFVYRRHPVNIGAVPNIASCIQSASRKHVWTISDDDVLDERALEVVLDRLRVSPDLGLLTLNHSARYVGSGVQRFSQCYPVADERHDPHGMELATYCLAFDHDGLALTTSQVYRTDLAQEAQRAWPTVENLAVQVYWSAYCARAGGMLLTADTLLECAAGSHFWTDNPVMAVRLMLADTPEVGRRLRGLGYDERVCHELTLQQLTPHNFRTLAAAFQVAPAAALPVLTAFSMAVWQAGPMQALAFVMSKLMRRLRDGGRQLEREQRSDRPAEAARMPADAL